MCEFVCMFVCMFVCLFVYVCVCVCLGRAPQDAEPGTLTVLEEDDGGKSPLIIF